MRNKPDAVRPVPSVGCTCNAGKRRAISTMMSPQREPTSRTMAPFGNLDKCCDNNLRAASSCAWLSSTACAQKLRQVTSSIPGDASPSLGAPCGDIESSGLSFSVGEAGITRAMCLTPWSCHASVGNLSSRRGRRLAAPGCSALGLSMNVVLRRRKPRAGPSDGFGVMPPKLPMLPMPPCGDCDAFGVGCDAGRGLALAGGRFRGEAAGASAIGGTMAACP
mmetsp:Transcript_101251/g.292805  ORF Transcript_101251/g.292805 Transcript_101251/m.292805 type:complete len:221 (-) Transcript_101251:177-839(-)